jgi:hypothetical protein
VSWTHYWQDAFEEISGQGQVPAASSWDVLAIRSKPPSEGTVSISIEDVDLRTDLGGSSAHLDLPIAITDNSGGLLSPKARLALVQAAARTGCALRIIDPTTDYLELASELDVTIWAVVGPRRTAADVEAIRSASIVEFQLGSMDDDGNLRTSLDALDSDGSLAATVETLRSVSEGASVIINVGSALGMDVLRTAYASGADGVMAEALSRRSPMHTGLVGGIPLSAVSNLRRGRARSRRPEGSPEPRLIVSGGFKDGHEVVKALALGADVIVMGTAPRISMGCTLCADCEPGECPKKPPVGNIAGGDQSPDWRTEADDLVAYLDRTVDQIRTALAQMGCATVGEVSLENLEALDYDTAAMTGAVLAGYGEPLPMWLH